MCHLSSGGLYAFVTLVHWVIVSVRMFHPLATACQDMSSFVRWPVRFCALCALGQPVKMSSGGFVRFYYACALCCSVCIGALGPCVVSSSWPVHLVTL